MPTFAQRNGATLLAVSLLGCIRRLDSTRTSDASASAGGGSRTFFTITRASTVAPAPWIAAVFGSAQIRHSVGTVYGGVNLEAVMEVFLIGLALVAGAGIAFLLFVIEPRRKVYDYDPGDFGK